MEKIIFVMLGFLTIIFLFQFYIRLKSWSKKGKDAPVVGGSVGKSIQRGEKVIIYFYSPTCGACRTQEKYLPKIQEKFQNIIRINAAKERELATAFGVMGTPTTIVIDQGKIKEYFVGITPSHKILKSL